MQWWIFPLIMEKKEVNKKLQIPSPSTHIKFIIWPCAATYMHGGLCIDSFTILSGKGVINY